MNVIEFEPWHCELIDLRYEQLHEMKMFKQTIANIQRQYAWTGAQDGTVIAIGGCVPCWDKVGEVWMLVSPNIGKHKVSVFKQLKHHTEWLMNHFERIQTPVLCGFDEGQRLVEHLKFTNEGTMTKYLFGRDYFRYARVR